MLVAEFVEGIAGSDDDAEGHGLLVEEMVRVGSELQYPALGFKAEVPDADSMRARRSFCVSLWCMVRMW